MSSPDGSKVNHHCDCCGDTENLSWYGQSNRIYCRDKPECKAHLDAEYRAMCEEMEREAAWKKEEGIDGW